MAAIVVIDPKKEIILEAAVIIMKRQTGLERMDLKVIVIAKMAGAWD